MKYNDIDICIRCGSNKIIKEYPVVHCQDCKTLIAIEVGRKDHRDEIKSIKFNTTFCHVCIMCWQNETYINGEKMINSSLPPTVSEEKLRTYITFS